MNLIRHSMKKKYPQLLLLTNIYNITIKSHAMNYFLEQAMIT